MQLEIIQTYDSKNIVTAFQLQEYFYNNLI